MKQNSFFIYVIFLLILILPLVSATGCFFYKDSAMYCQDIEQVQAQQECSNYDDCALQAVFIEGKSCESVNECKKVMCKSSCKLEFSGKCTTGIIPVGKEQEWCTDGCCKFNYGQNYCSYRTTKWLCEIEAWNKGVKGFAFDTVMKEEECKNYCVVELSSNEDITKGLKLEEVYSEQWSNTTSLQEQGVSEGKGNVNLNGTVNKSNNQDQNSGGVIWFVILLLFGVGIVYYFYTQNRKIGTKKSNETFEEGNIQTNKNSLLEDMEKDLEAAAIKVRLDEAKEKHAFKTKGKEREEFFAEFGLLSEHKNKSDLEKLKSLGRFYEMKKRIVHQILPSEEKKAFDKLEELVTRLKKVEQRVEGREKISKESIITIVESKEKEAIKKEAEEAMLALRKIITKK